MPFYSLSKSIKLWRWNWQSIAHKFSIFRTNRLKHTSVRATVFPNVVLDGCIVWNAHNTVLCSKRLPVCTCHLTQCRLCWSLPPYQVAFWSMQSFGHNRHRPKFRGLLCPLWGSWVPIQHYVVWADTYRHTKWHLGPSSRLTTVDMGQKVKAAVPWLSVLIWTVINWIVITSPNPNPNLNTNNNNNNNNTNLKPNTNPNPKSNPDKNPNPNRSPNPVLTVQISTI